MLFLKPNGSASAGAGSSTSLQHSRRGNPVLKTYSCRNRSCWATAWRCTKAARPGSRSWRGSCGATDTRLSTLASSLTTLWRASSAAAQPQRPVLPAW